MLKSFLFRSSWLYHSVSVFGGLNLTSYYFGFIDFLFGSFCHQVFLDQCSNTLLSILGSANILFLLSCSTTCTGLILLSGLNTCIVRASTPGCVRTRLHILLIFAIFMILSECSFPTVWSVQFLICSSNSSPVYWI